MQQMQMGEKIENQSPVLPRQGEENAGKKMMSPEEKEPMLQEKMIVTYISTGIAPVTPVVSKELVVLNHSLAGGGGILCRCCG